MFFGILLFFLTQSAIAEINIVKDPKTGEEIVIDTSIDANEDAVLLKKEDGVKEIEIKKTQTVQTVHSTEDSGETLLPYRSYVEIGLEYPLNFGGSVKFHLTDNFYTRLNVGFMAEFFLGSFAKLMPYFNYLNEAETAVIAHVFENSFYSGLRLGWFPYANNKDGGPYMELGLSGMFLGRGQVSGFTLSKALGLDNLSTDHYSLKTNAYNATYHVGYQVPFESLKLNFELGVIKILDSQVGTFNTLEAPNQLNKEQVGIFQKFLKDKGWIFPTGSIWISFQF